MEELFFSSDPPLNQGLNFLHIYLLMYLEELIELDLSIK